MYTASSPELQHTFISQSLQPGPTVSLKCSATGNPIPDLSWYVDGTELVSTWASKDDPLEARYWQISDRYSVGSYRQFTEIVSHVNITNVRVEDGGAYQCMASNLLGRVSHSARLNIYGKLFSPQLSLFFAPLSFVLFLLCCRRKAICTFPAFCIISSFLYTKISNVFAFSTTASKL